MKNEHNVGKREVEPRFHLYQRNTSFVIPCRPFCFLCATFKEGAKDSNSCDFVGERKKVTVILYFYVSW